MSVPAPTRAAIRELVRRALRRGVPPQEAEDIVAVAWERAVRTYDSDRGTFEAFLNRIVERKVADWWREHRRWRRVSERLKAESNVVALPVSDGAHDNQRRLLERLDPTERKVFAAWALQKHLKQGAFDARAAATSVGMTVTEFNNAKKRLRTRVMAVLDELGLEARDLWTVADDEGPRRKRHA